MYNVYVKRKGQYNYDLMGEFADIDKAINLADECKAKNSEIKYRIEETSGHFDSYGEPLTTVIQEG